MRATPKRFLKAVCAVSLFVFIVINMSLYISQNEENSNHEKNIPSVEVDPPHVGPLLRNHNSSITSSNVSGHNKVEKTLKPAADNSRQNDTAQPRQMPGRAELGPGINESNIPAIRDFITRANKQQEVLNSDIFTWKDNEDSVVVVVQVHNRPEYLKHLIDSLRKAKGVENILLVFSHDYFSEELNSIVHSIDFCLVIQIFYPFSMQTHPKEFPGEDPNDCPRNMKKDVAIKTNCNNAHYPDKYGHYREAKYSQTKHHWFWKINHVFDHIDIIKDFKGPVVLLEEDHYVVKDFLHGLGLMYKLKPESCGDCSIMTLGTYDKNPTYGPFSAKVEITGWMSSKHNMGMTMNREVWDKIKKCATPFCSFDDYNWDWSLQFISSTCIPGKLRVMLMKSPRVFHIGECGVHHKGKNCDPADRVRHIENLLNSNQQHLFPEKLTIHGYPRSVAKVPKANGGWGDRRDHDMCNTFVDPQTHR